MSDKEAGQVLTSENSAEFYANKLGLADQPETEATDVEPDRSEEQSESTQDEAKPTEEKKQNPKLERRFSELTKQREQAKAEAEAERNRSAQLEARLRSLEQQAAPQRQSVNSEPQPGQFQDAFEYAKALAEFSTEKALNERDQRDAQARANVERQKVIETWNSKLEKTKADIPDYDEMVSTANVVVSDEIRDAILESDVGPRILYDLAENLEFAQKLAQMPVTKALREIGRLEAKYDKVDAPKETVVKSKAPAPARPLRAGNGAADIPINSNGEFHGTYQSWKEARRAGKIR
jgi:chromosome segregation ATPase